MGITIASAVLVMWSLEPASLYEELLSYSGDGSRKFDSSSGSDFLVSKILPGILRPLSNLCRQKKYEKGTRYKIKMLRLLIKQQREAEL